MKTLSILASISWLAACSAQNPPASNAAPAAPSASPSAAAPKPAGDTAQMKPAAPAPTPLAEGAPAPDFKVPTSDGGTFELSAAKGKPVVVYFYPKDFTGGCTIEAQSFRDGQADFDKLGAKVVGISLDTMESHKGFAEKEKLQFALVADTSGEIASKYGVDTSGGYARRVTFVVGPDGKVFKVFPKVNVQGHEAEVLAAVKASMGT